MTKNTMKILIEERSSLHSLTLGVSALDRIVFREYIFVNVGHEFLSEIWPTTLECSGTHIYT